MDIMMFGNKMVLNKLRNEEGCIEITSVVLFNKDCIAVKFTNNAVIYFDTASDALNRVNEHLTAKEKEQLASRLAD